MHDRPPARIACLLEAYLAADYRWEYRGQWRRISIGQPAPDVDAAFPAASRYGLLSAWNPHSVIRDEGLNRMENLRLHERLRAAGVACQPAFACAPDRSWREPGWLALDLAPEALDRLARAFGQLGTLYWERGAPVRLRMDAAAPAACAGLACVDWLK